MECLALSFLSQNRRTVRSRRRTPIVIFVRPLPETRPDSIYMQLFSPEGWALSVQKRGGERTTRYDHDDDDDEDIKARMEWGFFLVLTVTRSARRLITAAKWSRLCVGINLLSLGDKSNEWNLLSTPGSRFHLRSRLSALWRYRL